jgi:PDZ domain-containing protein
MLRFILFAIAAMVASAWLAAAPVPTDAKVLVSGLSDPSEKVRNEAAAALRGRADAQPWLRRAARSADADTAKRAASLLAPHEPKRQAAAAKAIDACIKSGRVDLFMEWHHYWQPENKDDLWPVGPRMVRVAQVVQEECAKWFPPAQSKRLEETLNFESVPEPGWKPRYYDGPLDQMSQELVSQVGWSIRTDRWWKFPQSKFVSFASIAGPAWFGGFHGAPSRAFVLAPVQASRPQRCPFVVCDGEFYHGDSYMESSPEWSPTNGSFVVCRGNFRASSVGGSVLLVDGNVELFGGGVRDSLIRASGEITIPKNAKVVNSTIEPQKKNATAPYKFFELSEVGLSVADDEEGMVVAAVTANTPFGNCGLMKGDIIQAIDDVRPGPSSEFRKKVRKAMVVQGDCLLTVARGDKTIDLPVFFPLPK